MALTQVNKDDACIKLACPNCGVEYTLTKARINANRERTWGYVCLKCNAQFTGKIDG